MENLIEDNSEIDNWQFIQIKVSKSITSKLIICVENYIKIDLRISLN